MRSLFAFLWKYQFTVLFIILETIALLLLSDSYSYHKSIAGSTINDLTGGVFSVSNNVSGYFSLRKNNEQLLEENARLKNSLSSSFLTTDTTFAYSDTLFRYIPAHVISNSVNKRNNFIMIDKGRLHGIKKEMGVVSSTGLAGIVTGVSDHYAVAMSMLNMNIRISASILKNNQLVNVIWNNMDYRFGEVIDIPSHITLQKGDTIVTSGNSLIFPKGINIGTIVSHDASENKSLGKAKIRFSTDFNSLGFVYVIRNMMIEEQSELINESGDE